MASQDQEPIVGWLMTDQRPGQAWPGVLLHRNALMIRGPIKLLAMPAPDLHVVIETGERLDPAIRVGEVVLLEVDGAVDDPVTAMVRLEIDADLEVSKAVNRSGFDIALRVTGDAWKAVASLGLVPEDLSDRPPPHGLWEVSRPPASPSPVTIRTVSVQPDGWCNVFWWLC